MTLMTRFKFINKISKHLYLVHSYYGTLLDYYNIKRYINILVIINQKYMLASVKKQNKLKKYKIQIQKISDDNNGQE